MNTMTKRCSRCGRLLPHDQFRCRRHRSGNVGPAADCNDCHKAYNESLRRRDAGVRGRMYRTREDIAQDQARWEEQAQREGAAQARARAADLDEKKRRAAELLEREAEQERREAEAAKRLMPHARAIDDDLLRSVDWDAFWSHVNKNGPMKPHMDTPCWEWTSQRKGNGYGRAEVIVNGKRVRVAAHRLAWAITNGTVPNGLCVLHRCDFPSCARPEHLFLGKPADNVADMMVKGREAYPPGTIPPQFVPFLAAGPVPGSRAAVNTEKTVCPKCGGPLIASPHASQGGRRRCPPCTRAYEAEHRAEWKSRHQAKRLLEEQA